ncbi:MAG: sigma-70 family RNA polymerase sigma factor [Oscillospiraceae bacterium]|nr:sigma-70 family RNA polymerase sigma factor [Oscillospiraceae bacterium]
MFESERATDEILTAELEAERTAVLEAQIEQDEHPSQPEDASQHTILMRDLRRIAQQRLEESARTQEDFIAVVALWDKLDVNRERRERYHEVSRGNVPLEYEAAPDGLIFPALHDPMQFRAIQSGNLEDVVFDCPFEMHHLVADPGIVQAIAALKDEHKEILFYYGLHLLSTAAIGQIRCQTQRNIRKVRATLIRKIQARLLTVLKSRLECGLPLTTTERKFFEEHR